MYCDYHGHSRRKNVFLYGCSPALSWMPEDTDNPAFIGNRMEDTSYKVGARCVSVRKVYFERVQRIKLIGYSCTGLQ